MLRRSDAIVAVLLAIAGVVVALAVVAPRHGGRLGVMGDAHYVYAAARSIAGDFDVDIRDELDELGDPWRLGEDPATDGVQLPVRELGPALLMVPGLWLAAALDQPPRSWPVFATLPMALSWSLVFLGICRALGGLSPQAGAPTPAVRTCIALVATLGLPGAFYAVGYSGYAHGPDAAICAWLTAALVRDESPIAVGSLVALAVLFRLQNALWLLWPAWIAIVAAKGGVWREPLRRLSIIAVIAMLGTLPQAIMAARHPGSTRGAVRWGLEFFDVHHFGGDMLDVLVGVHGLFTWTPIAALGVLGLAIAAARRDSARGPMLPALMVVLALVLLCAAARDPAAGHAFGARRLAGIVGPLALGLAALRARASVRAVHLLDGALVLLTLANVVLVILAIDGRVSLAP